MTHKQRVINCLSRKSFDRLPVRYMGEPTFDKRLMEFLGILDKYKTPVSYSYPEALVEYLGDDFRYVQPRYNGPERKKYADGTYELPWPDRGWPVPVRYIDQKYGDGKAVYKEVHWSPFKNIKEVSELEKIDFPSADWIDYSEVKEQCTAKKDYAIITGTPGVLGFVTGISLSRGLEQVLMDIAFKDPVYLKLQEKSFEFHYEMMEKTLRAGDGLIDIVSTGDDLGLQGGLLISPESFNELFAEKYRKFGDMVHRYGAKFMLHSCGSVYKLIRSLIDAGLDILDVVQTSAAEMDIQRLHAEFSKALCFCGTMCVQSTLPYSTVKQIEAEVKLREKLFAGGGLILGPSHLIQEDTPLENVIAMYQTAGSLKD